MASGTTIPVPLEGLNAPSYKQNFDEPPLISVAEVELVAPR